MTTNRRSSQRKLSKLDLMGIRCVDADEIEGAAPDETAKPDSGAYEAKIAELSAQLEAKDVEIAALGAQLNAAKAHNYDLLMGASVPDEEPVVIEDEVDDADTDIDDLFGKDDD